MDMGKVIGTVVATQKDPTLVGMRLLVVQPITATGEATGTAQVAVDTEGLAGVGDLVYTVTGGDASFSHPEREMPTDAAIVGLVNTICVTDLNT